MHTAGPWLFDDNAPDKMRVILPPDGRGGITVIATMRYADSESEANAKLIAAAPSMYAELMEVLEWARVEGAPLRQQEIDSIERVLAKARGNPE